MPAERAQTEDGVKKIGRWMMAGSAALAAALFAFGCETSSLEDEGTVTLAQLQGLAETNAVADADTTATDTTTDTTSDTSSTDTTSDGTSTNSVWPAEIDGPIHWLHHDVTKWAVTASISVSFSGGRINFPYSKSKVWPAVDGVNGNPWVIAKIDGTWYAATFEWLSFGQTSKPTSTVGGGNIKAAPMSGSWAPRSGQRVGIMVSGLARSKTRNVEERTEMVMVTWP